MPASAAPHRQPADKKPRDCDAGPLMATPPCAGHRSGWWWLLLSVVAAICLGAIILTQFGWQRWTAILLANLLDCSLALVWGGIQALRRMPLVLGPAPDTRGITIDWLAPVYDQMCWVMGLGLAMRRRVSGGAKIPQV